MAITLKIDGEQLQSVLDELRVLSNTVESGFTALIGFLGGADDAAITEAATRIREQRERLQESVNNQPKGE